MLVQLDNETGRHIEQIDDDFDCITVIECEDGTMRTVAMRCEDCPDYDICDG